MATTIRPELSPKNKYRLDKHRYYELKHFCLQYPEWKRAYSELESASIPTSLINRVGSNNTPSNPTEKRALLRMFYSDRIKLIERAAMEADVYLYSYILKGITENLSYTYLKSKLDIPCGRDMYYDRYRKFFWILNEIRN